MYAEGFHPKEVDFMVVDNHPTLLNVTLHPSKVGNNENNQLHLWQPPWLGIIKHHEDMTELTEIGKRGDRSLFFGFLSQANVLVIFSLEQICLVLISLILVR